MDLYLVIWVDATRNPSVARFCSNQQEWGVRRGVGSLVKHGLGVQVHSQQLLDYPALHHWIIKEKCACESLDALKF